MNTKLLMISSALIMAVCGVVLEFLPHEVLNFYGASADNFTAVLLQIAGALFLGFAVMNWMAKAVLIGGIYARPLAMGNFLHWTVGALALVKFAVTSGNHWTVWAATVIYAIFAVLFAVVFLTHPLKRKNSSDVS